MNNSGINPCFNRVLVKPDSIETKTEGGILIPETEAEKRKYSQSTGVLVAVGEDAFREYTMTRYRLIDGSMKPVEQEVTGHTQPFAETGDRVAYAKYQGSLLIGEDGEEYQLLNDTDLTARISDKVNFTDLHARKRLGEK